MRNEKNESLTTISIIMALFFLAVSILSFILGFYNLDNYITLNGAEAFNENEAMYICTILFFFFNAFINLALTLTIPFIMQRMSSLFNSIHNLELDQTKQNETLRKHENAIDEFSKIKCKKCNSLNLKDNEHCWLCGEKLDKEKKD